MRRMSILVVATLAFLLVGCAESPPEPPATATWDASLWNESVWSE